MKKIIFPPHSTGNNIWVNNAFDLDNSHTNRVFSAKVAPLFCKYVIDVIESVAE